MVSTVVPGLSGGPFILLMIKWWTATRLDANITQANAFEAGDYLDIRSLIPGDAQ